ncbi:MAG: transposase, partial [Muribaculaceae bacterium]|nr:transposase [Muribaculaceae bacterium]
ANLTLFQKFMHRHFGLTPTFYEHADEILNFFDNRSTNASAESINSKIKAFRAKLHGVNDTKFFIFRLCNIYA